MEEYFSEYTECREYLEMLSNKKYEDYKMFPPELYKAIMIKWPDNDAFNWFGPFEGNYVFCRIEDYTYVYPDIPTEEEIDLKQKTFEMYMSYNIPPKAFSRIFNHDKLFFITKGTDGKEYSRSSLTHEEYQKVILELTEEEMKQRDYNIKHNLKFKWSLTEVNKEFPVKIYLCGDDDDSYTKLDRNKKEADEEVENLIDINNDMRYIKKNYIFTN